ncbi:MAG: hypothetical protein EXS15_08230 [Phycisphaerales bacterium]|nr:hypothetical protein [Phycisphaerales bacterium]
MDKKEYNRLLFVLAWTSKVLQLGYPSKGSDAQTHSAMKQAFEYVVKPAASVASIDDLLAEATIKDPAFPTRKLTSTTSDPAFYEMLKTAMATLNQYSGVSRCTWHGRTIDGSGTVSDKVKSIVFGSSGGAVEASYLDMPLYSIALVFHIPLTKWIKDRQEFVDFCKGRLKEGHGDDDTRRSDFPWLKICTEMDTELGALADCQFDQVSTLAKAAKKLLTECRSTGKGNQTTP